MIAITASPNMNLRSIRRVLSPEPKLKRSLHLFKDRIDQSDRTLDYVFSKSGYKDLDKNTIPNALMLNIRCHPLLSKHIKEHPVSSSTYFIQMS